MSIALTLFNDELLDFHPGLPGDFRGPVLQGAVPLSSRSNIADLVVQDLMNEHYSIRFSIARFFRNVTAKGRIKVPGLYIFMMLKSGIWRELDSVGRMHIRQDQYSSLFTGTSECRASFEMNVEYRSLDLFYSPGLLEELLGYFPDLKRLMLSPRGETLPGKTCWTLPSMKEIANQLLTCPYGESTRQFFFDLKVRELLFQMLENAYSKTRIWHHFTPWEIARIHEVRAILENYIARKPPSLRSLSKLVAINEFKLKMGFRQYFKMGIFEYLLERKMQYAKELLLTTNYPIKDICTRVGYPRTTNFITAFRRRFGMTPGSMRRK